MKHVYYEREGIDTLLKIVQRLAEEGIDFSVDFDPNPDDVKGHWWGLSASTHYTQDGRLTGPLMKQIFHEER